MLTLITGRGKSGKTRLLLEAVKACPTTQMASRIVLVPEQLSHETERLLSELCGDSISFTAEVLSFTRLCDRVFARSGGGARPILDQGGRILTARLALDGIRPQLKVFGAAAGKPEFLGSMVSMVDELKSYGVTTEILTDASHNTTGLFSEKLSELALILGAYEAATAQGARDPRDRLSLLRKKLLNGDYARGKHFFVDGFTDFSGQELRILEAILRTGESLTVTVPAGQGEDALFAPGMETLGQLTHLARQLGIDYTVKSAEYQRPIPPALTYLEQQLMGSAGLPYSDTTDAVTVLSAPTVLEECQACAAVLQKKAMEGMRFRDMAICCGDENVYSAMLTPLFASLGIPLYRAEKRQVLAHPVARFVLLALECATEGMEQETVLSYLKTGYPGLSRDQVDLLENYCVVWGIRGNRFFSEWTMHPDGYDGRFTDKTEQALKNLAQWQETGIFPLKRLSEAMKTAQDVLGQLTALYAFLTETKLYEQLEQQIARETEAGQLESAQETAQIYTILLTCLQQTADVAGSLRLKGSELCRMVKLALSQYQVGTIPAVLDAVTLGSVASMRGKQPKLIYILGANQGSMPAVSVGGSLLSEQERQALRQQFDICLAPDAEGNLQRQLLELYGAFTCADRYLYVSYLTGGEQTPSFLVDRILQLFPQAMGSAPADTGYTPGTAAQLCLSASEEDGTVPLGAAISAASRQLPALREALDQGKRWSEPRETDVSKNVAEKLFGNPVELTASKLDQFANCPLEFFLLYGLKAKIRQEATFNAAEFGTFVHYILEKSVPELILHPGEYTEEQSLALVDAQMPEYTLEHLEHVQQTSRQNYLLRRNRREAALLVQEISQELTTTDFVPCGYEISLGGRDGLPALRVQGQLGEGTLSGFVDRADLWKSPGGNYLRIIDYKTGKKDFSYTDLTGGAGMQMLLYLFALERSGLPDVAKDVVPAGVLYLPARKDFGNGKSPQDPDLEKGPNRRSGIILAEDGVPEAMEHGEKLRFMPAARGKPNPDYVLSRQQFTELRDYVEDRMAQVVDRILGGYFPAKPFYRGPSHDPCSWCKYGSVCQKDPQFRKSCYHAKVTPKEFWALFSKGDEQDG